MQKIFMNECINILQMNLLKSGICSMENLIIGAEIKISYRNYLKTKE